MLRNRLYYRIKPLVPWRLRIALRRWLALRNREKIRSVWPIKAGTETTPPGWPGWPDGKKFALVLTHDVEGRNGLAKCRTLMQLEHELGFRSSFNFVPEGEYSLPGELREELVQNGCEVGVHDLRHDGKLYRTRSQFNQNATRINQYLEKWSAVGFRSAFMLRNLSWLHELNIQYDASTFDTDPFEPQPDGRNTIFPFWVSNGNGGGYAELPYTLPQDSTLFLLLRERTMDIWSRKLDWVAQHGGMALLNVHPDYLRFDGESAARRTYPVELYGEFLKYVRSRYGDTFWQPLPKEMARFIAAMKPAPARLKLRRVCMLTHSFYEHDNRVTRYAEALAERGDEVDVVALRRSRAVPAAETMAGVNVFRVQLREGKKEQAKLAYLVPLMRFLFVSSWWLTRRHIRNRYDLIHVHNIPDFLVFAAWCPKLTGARVILDIHDVVPEFFASKFSAPAGSRMVAALRWMERLSARFAHHVILANHLWLDKYVARSAATRKCSVFINHVDTRIFRPQLRRQREGKRIILFPGGLQWHQGLDVAIRAFRKLSDRLDDVEFHIFGEGNMKPELTALAQNLGLNGKVCFFEPLRVREIAKVMAEADLGVVPKRADSFGNEAYSTKIMEFMSLNVPVVVSSTKIDRHYFNDSVVRFFESGNSDALAEAMFEILENAELRQRMVTRAADYTVRNSWESYKAHYLDLVDSLGQSEDPE